MADSPPADDAPLRLVLGALLGKSPDHPDVGLAATIARRLLPAVDETTWRPAYWIVRIGRGGKVELIEMPDRDAAA